MFVAALFLAASVENVVVDGVDFDVFTPSSKVIGDVLVLPGWDSTKTNWCEKQNGLCDEAEKRGLRLVMPEMAKSVYADRIYPETSALFRKQLTRTQLEDAIVHLQRDKALLANPSTTFCIGRSTGGRGCVLLALDHPEWFRAVASLSGDFDQTKMPSDGLMEGAYGPFAKFHARWRGSENPMDRVDDLVVPIYLGHGAKDRTVSPEQTKDFAAAIAQRSYTGTAAIVLREVLPHRLHLDESGAHNHEYWRRELAPMFDFFASTPDPIERAKGAFAFWKSLAGRYSAQEAGAADSSATFDVDARGTALAQHSGFVAVFALDGASLVCHAFVDDGWSVTMRAVPEGSHMLRFRVVDAENTAKAPLTAMTMFESKAALYETWFFAKPLNIRFVK
jgi:S-formylglutathione hydrolase FrmB